MFDSVYVAQQNNKSSQGAQQQQQQQQQPVAAADMPIDEVKAAAAEIQQEVTNALHETQQSIQTQVHELEKKTRSLLPGLGGWLRQQRLTSRQFYIDLFNQSTPTKVLFGALLFFNFFCSFLFLNHIEGWVVLTSYVGVSILSHCLYTLTPKSSPYRLFNSTLSHIVWIPMLFWLSHRSSTYDYSTSSKSMEHVDVSVALMMKKSMFFSEWLMCVLIVNTIALGNDIFQLVNIMQNEKGQKNVKKVVETVTEKVESGAEQLLNKAEGMSQAERQYAFARHQQANASKNDGLKQRNINNVAAPTA